MSREKNKKNRTVWRYISEVAGRLKWNVLVISCLRALASFCSVCYALFLRAIVNSAVDGDQNAFFLSVAGFAALVAFRMILQAVNRYLMGRTSAALEIRFKDRMFSELLHRDYGSVTAVHSGEWMNRLTSDTETLAENLTRFLPNVIGMTIRLTGSVVLMIVLEPRFLYLIVPMVLLMLLFSVPFRTILRRLQRKVRETEGKVRAFLQETIGDLLVVRAFVAEKDVTEDAEKKMEVNRKARMKHVNFSNLCNTGFSAVMNLSYILTAAFCGYGILTGTMSYGNFTAMLELIGQVSGPLENIGGLLPTYSAMMVSAERLMEVEQLPEDEESGLLPLTEILECYERDFQAVGFSNASFTYLMPDRDDLTQVPVTVKGMKFEIKKGEYAAFVGPSGSGKSTVQKLLMCLYPLDEGERYILTGKGREPLTGAWRRLFAYVPQGNQLLSGTVREIVTFADRDGAGDDERIWQALRIACADEFVLELEDGLDTQLGERGQGISEGQMQRLAIARAVFSERPILLLDECTSALDPQTEERLLRHLRDMTDKTVIIVTHRPAALQICDQVLTFSEDGQITSKIRERADDGAGV